MRQTVFHGVLSIAILTLSCVTMSSDADAAYSGLVTRVQCAAGGYKAATTNDWLSVPFGSGCAIQWVGSSPGILLMHLPVERRTTNTTIVANMKSKGTGADATGRICQSLWTYGSNGAIFQTAPTVCTVGAVSNDQSVPSSTITLPVQGTASIVVSATSVTSVSQVSWTYTSNGT